MNLMKQPDNFWIVQSFLDGPVEVKRRKIEKPSKPEKPTAKKSQQSEKVSTKITKEEDNILVQPPKNWKAEEEAKKVEAKKKAAELMKKIREIAPKKKKSQNKRYQIKRQVLNKHNLSESEIDW